MEVEKIYQKKSQLEHILLRPDTYIGSVEMLEQEMWIWDFENEKMIKKQISFVPGLYKIFDEILVNASDNKQRDKNMSIIRVNIDKENNTIKVFNNGKGIPVVEHKEEKVLVPTLIFGHLLTSSNYNDDEKKVTGGRNGYGAKLCNIFSKKFVLETSSKEYKKSFKQTWTNNMSKVEEPIVKDAKEDDFTCITFVPDLVKFKMGRLDDDTVALLARRAYDVAASTPGVKVYLNDKRLPINKFEDYCKLYLNQEIDESGNPNKLIYEKFSDRWEVAVACSDMGFQQVSFVNSIATTKGGRHVDYITDQLVKNLTEIINKKNKNGQQIKPFQIKNHMWLFINCLIENPTFDSQTKENMTLQSKSFGSKCNVSDDFVKKLTKCGLVDRILNWLAFKEKTDLEKAGSKSKVSKLRGIPKLDDANDAGTKESINCTLIVTEGDSAKTLAVAGLGVIGRDKYGVFPLRGKMLNVREATTKQIVDNSEVSNLLKIIGLNFKEKYETKESLKQLRYGKLMIMTDQDHDGSHIKGLIINFVHHQWPNLLKHGFVEEFITPIVKVSKGSNEKSFYSMPEFEEWQQKTDNWNTWKIKYYKGLGTSTSKEAKEYFSDMQRHRIKFGYSNMRDDLAIQMAFSKKYVDERKDWLTRFMEDRKTRRETNAVDNYLYQKNTKEITFCDFVNKELVLFSNLDNERSIPCMIDGFKPGQRKVLFSCFKRNLVKELKVAQLAGSVAELSAYHHGEASLMSTIINLAQNYVGSNNINLLLPIGQFGTRLHGGKDHASARYIFTCLSQLTRLLFNPKDDPLYNYLSDDGFKVEPEWYCPIIPTILVNGAEGIGTGWSTKLPNYNPREIIQNLKLMINGQEPKTMVPHFKNFTGKIEQIDEIRVVTSGRVAVIGENTIEITELPIGCWTQVYKEQVLEPSLHGSTTEKDGNKAGVIQDYREYHTDTTVRFVVKMTADQFKVAQKTGFHKFFKLQKTISLNSMVFFDANGCLKRYDSVKEILTEFFHVRLQMYKKRKAYMEGMLGAESLKLDNIARFILEKIEGKIRVENVKKAEICKILKARNYDPDPVVTWKKKVSREQGYEGDDVSAETNSNEDEEIIEEGAIADKKDYDYLLGMPIWNLTMEKKDELLKQQKNKGEELSNLKAKSPEQLWQDDLNHFLEELNKFEAKEKEDEVLSQSKAFKAGNQMKAAGSSIADKHRKAAPAKITKKEYLPAEDGELVEPIIDQALIAKSEKEQETKDLKKTKMKEEKGELNLVDIITNNSEEAQKLDDKQIIEILQRLSKPAARGVGAGTVKKAPTEKKLKQEKSIEDNDKDCILTDQDDQVVVSSEKKKEKTTENATKKRATGTAGSKSKKTSVKAAKTSPDGKNTINKYFKKKSTKSSDEESDSSSLKVLNTDDEDEEFSDNEEVERRVISRQRKPIKYNVDAEDDESNDKFKSKRSSDDDDYDIQSEKEVKSKTKKMLISDDDDEDDFKKNKSADKKKEKIINLDDSDDEKEKKVFAASSKDNKKKEEPASKSKRKPALNDSDVEDVENKPLASIFLKKNASKTSLVTKPETKKTKAAPKSAQSKPKKTKYDDDDEENEDMNDFIASESDSEYESKKRPKPTKKLLLKKNEPEKFDLMKKTASASNLRKKPKNMIPSDDDLFEVDD